MEYCITFCVWLIKWCCHRNNVDRLKISSNSPLQKCRCLKLISEECWDTISLDMLVRGDVNPVCWCGSCWLTDECCECVLCIPSSLTDQSGSCSMWKISHFHPPDSVFQPPDSVSPLQTETSTVDRGLPWMKEYWGQPWCCWDSSFCF